VASQQSFPFLRSRAIFAVAGEFCHVCKQGYSSRSSGRDPKRATPAAAKPSQISPSPLTTLTKTKTAERQKRIEWHKIVVWGKQAEIAQQYLKKGSLIFIEGRIQSRDGRTRKARSAPASKLWPAISACSAAAPQAPRSAVAQHVPAA